MHAGKSLIRNRRVTVASPSLIRFSVIRMFDLGFPSNRESVRFPQEGGINGSRTGLPATMLRL
jgi:hypothetical protein